MVQLSLKAKEPPKAKSDKKADFTDFDLRQFDLTRKYDEDFSPADGISWREHALLYMIGVFLLIMIVWSSVAKVDEVARGEGKVIPASEVQVIQSLEGGIIDAIPVKDGDEVQEGQVVLRMRNVQAGADLASTEQRYLGLLATTTRLQAESNGTALSFPDDIVKGAPDMVTAEQDAYNANKKNNDSEAAIETQQYDQKKQEVAELEAKIKDTNGVMKLTQSERDMVAPMVERGSSSKKELLDLDRQLASEKTDLNALTLSLPRARAAAQELRERINNITSAFKAQAQKELAEKTVELNTVKQTLAGYQDKSERNDIKSPVHGTVKDIRITTVGGVAKPGEPIMEIVPLEDKLLVESHIKPSDIAFIHAGQKATVRLSSFDSSIYGTLDGQVLEVSPDSMTTEKGESYYRVRVKTDKTQLTKNGKTYAIIPGMQATVDIVTGEKTVLNYLIKPFAKAAQTAMTER
jgi:adhesin transport system membrane fusion protein